jgi:amidase
MPVRRLSETDIARISDAQGLELSPEEIADFETLCNGVIAGYEVLDGLPEPARKPIDAVRDPGREAGRDEDPLNGVVRFCDVRAVQPSGSALKGKTIGVKDTICVSGVPMGCASRLLYDYTPHVDATVVTRILDAGGRITAVLNTDDFAFSGGGHTSVHGPGLNPRDPAYAAGGSSCGSAIAPATGQVDIALGGDQGGSIRIPSSWSGIVGLKPTHGLVPYTGIVGFDQTIDHVGPMATTVADAALLLGVIAGRDETAIDPRQPAEIAVPDYGAQLTGKIDDLKIAVVAEGFGSPDSRPEVDAAVRAAAEELARKGATVERVSVPEHAWTVPIWNAVAIEGGVDSFDHGHACYQTKGWFNTKLMSAMRRAIKTHAADYSATAKLGVLISAYMAEQYDGVFYAKAQNLARQLTAAYDKVFERYDLVLMPTTPQTAHPRIAAEADDRCAHVGEALNMVRNTAAFDLTGHPSISVPCKDVPDRPIGLMLTGRAFRDDVVLRCAHAYAEA